MLECGFASREEGANIEVISHLPAEGCSILQLEGVYMTVQGWRLDSKEGEPEHERFDTRNILTKLGGAI